VSDVAAILLIIAGFVVGLLWRPWEADHD